ncbi:hypothetical protein MSG28_013883 [Choristoneura fumiferana]|uniref:Uncharacterized protein n=1 Tax=Choristoneura fumiferana TaxID=7141 RepID=A0ACC0K9U8_CHOFU|nr:hypothetical protein MSG28_013883 [Choristoneura fumiferana]
MDELPSWRAGPPLRRARAGLGLAELEGALYAAGGFSGREFLACVEWLPSPEAEWTALQDPPTVPPPLPSPKDKEGALNGQAEE